jgi:lipopolysaccharide biosynthesis regulator YciM
MTECAIEWSRPLEEAAIQARDPVVLAAVLELSAVLADRVGDRLAAEAQWVRALAVRRQLAERTELMRLLRELIEFYGTWRRWHRALDAAAELLQTARQDESDHQGMARALADLGTTMLRANRPQDAARYLRQAAESLSRLDSTEPVEHARVLTALGRAQHGDGHPILATRSFTAALALCDGHDESLTDEVRALLAEKTPRRGHRGDELGRNTTRVDRDL